MPNALKDFFLPRIAQVSQTADNVDDGAIPAYQALWLMPDQNFS
jgi:hypothetical protein